MNVKEFWEAAVKLCKDSGFYLFPEADGQGLCFSKEKDPRWSMGFFDVLHMRYVKEGQEPIPDKKEEVQGASKS